MRMTVGRKIPVMFKAEYIAFINDDLCTGCRKCLKVCQFNALGFNSSKKMAVMNKENCYGCGICRSMCEKNAITLQTRS